MYAVSNFDDYLRQDEEASASLLENGNANWPSKIQGNDGYVDEDSQSFNMIIAHA